ncbi:type VII toxin-antitoxin system MntA family adenylyltransferase antitoxin [Ktedonobacter robiniae]|uniref:Polymerase beta nucleotidyltransferase domain-containing protein n=1 Tax=Ktedonobacter robiniae TaxID=2778365 RepID=A0ABQ3UPZ5_9CHLR|nr:HepT-like ribonuclease domain-containing protein [Ktedonobacter robiniae]GHO54768.1 hypothetical protein KSB_32430 [Ktedonobacter robiniae]
MNLFEKQTQLTQLFAQNPVNAAYLTGSLSNRASFGQLSDVDIAILLMDQVKADQFLDYQLYFFSELAKRLESESIDVVILNKASLLLKSQIIKHGQILFSRDERQRILFESRAVMAYLDFKKFDEIQNQALSRRLRGPAHQPVDPELIRPPLTKLREAIRILRNLQAEPRETFLNDHRLYGLAERYLQQAIENYLYICSAFVTAMGLPKPDDFHNLLSSLAAQQLIPRTLAFRLELLTNLREELLRTTSSQTRELVYEHLQYRLETLEEFSTAIEASL